MLRRVALVRTDVSEELSAFFIRVTRIGELGTAVAVTSNRRTYGVTSQKTPVFIVTTVKTSNRTRSLLFCNTIHFNVYLLHINLRFFRKTITHI
jgi:hypothetical protein